jgi:hypothetical protein
VQNVNLFRLLNQLKGDDEFRIRVKLLSRLKDRDCFNEDDINDIFSYKGMEHHPNPDAKKITQKVFASVDVGEKFRLLRRLNGVGLIMASNILMFQNPLRYAEASHVSWNVLVGNYGLKAPEKDERSDFSLQEYETFLNVLKSLANEFGMNVGDVEYVLSHVE